MRIRHLRMQFLPGVNGVRLSFCDVQHLFCVPDCRKAHSSYVNDVNTRKCARKTLPLFRYLDAGEHCAASNWVYGCEDCPQATAGQGWQNLIQNYINYQYISPLYATTFRECGICSTPKICYKCQDTSRSTCTDCNYPANDQTNTSAQCDSQSNICLKALGQNVCSLSCNASQYYPEHVQCNLALSNNVVTFSSWKACKDGYVHPDTGLCVSSCGLGYYGSATYSSIGTVQQSTCSRCHRSCYECSGPTGSDCLSCPYGHYLYVGPMSGTNGAVSKGQCILKQQGNFTQTIYVNTVHEKNTKWPPDQIAGTYSDAFNSLIDAIAFAYHLGAPYTSAEITILLKNGLHAMTKRRNPKEIVFPANRDENSQTTKIIIDTEGRNFLPLLYKLRDQWTFKVGGGLTVKNIMFDASDSSFTNWHEENNCTYLETDQCCFLNRSDSTMECLVNQYGASFFKFDLDERTMLTFPPTLRLENVKFLTFLYDFYSLIEFNDYGGYLSMFNVDVTDIASTCGSFIRKKPKTFIRNNNINPSSFDTFYAERVNNYQYQLYKQEDDLLKNLFPYQRCSDNPETTGLPTCFSMALDQVYIFTVGMHKLASNHAIWVDPQYNMKYYGSIIDVDDFRGDIRIASSYLINNQFKMENCDVAEEMDSGIRPYVDLAPNMGNKTDLQIRSVISIINHSHNFDMINSTLNVGFGTKGTVFIEQRLRDNNKKRIFIRGVEFKLGGGYIDNSGIFIRLRGPKLESVYTKIPNNGDKFCSGVHIEQVSFAFHFGCFTKGGSVVRIECVDYNQTQSSPNDRYTFQTLSQATANAYYAINASQHIAQWVTLSYNGITANVDLNRNILTNNKFVENYVTGGKPLIEIQGLPYIVFNGDLYSQTGESTQEMVFTLGFNGQYMNISSYYPNLDNITMLDSLFNHTNLGCSVLRIQRAHYVEINGVTFSENFLLENDFTYERANVAIFKEVYGQVSLKSLSIMNLFGMNNKQVVSRYFPKFTYLTELEMISTKFPLFSYQTFPNKILFTDFLSGSNTIRNITYNQDPSNTQAHMLFNLGSDNSGNYDIYSNLELKDSVLMQLQCISCTRAPLKLSTKSFTLSNTTVSYLNQQIYSSGYYQHSPFFDISIRKPYTISGNVITEQIIIKDSCVFEYNYFGLGRLFEINQVAISNSQTPSTYQIQILNSQMNYNYQLNSSGIIHINAPDFWTQISGSTFTGNQMTNIDFAQKGGYFYIESLTRLDITGVQTDLLSAVRKNSVGGGQFIYWEYLGQNLNLSISSSTIKCASPERKGIPDPSVTKNQGSALYLDSSGGVINLSLTGNKFEECGLADYGGALFIKADSASSVVTITGNTFKENSGVYGGSIYTKGGQITISSNTFNNSKAYDGGDVYIENPINNIINFDSNSFNTSLAYNNGGSVYYTLNQTSSTMNQNFQSLTFQNATSINEGGSLYLISNTFNLTFSNTKVVNSASNYSGGFMSLPYSNTTLNLTLKNSSFSGISSNRSMKGFLSTNSALQIANLSITDSNFTDIKSLDLDYPFNFQCSNYVKIKMSNCKFNNTVEPRNGLFYLKTGVVDLNIDSSSFANQASKTLDGGSFYIESTGDSNIQVTNSQFSNISTNFRGGSFYVKAQNLNFILSSSTISGSTSLMDGGFLYSLVNNPTGQVDFVITNSQFSNIQSLMSGGLAFISGDSNLNTNVSIQNSMISGASSNNQGGSFYIKSKDLNFQMNQYSSINGSQSGEGGFLQADMTTNLAPILTLKDIVVQGAKSNLNGGFLVINGQSTMNNTLVFQNLTVSDGGSNSSAGFLSLNGMDNQISISNCTFTNMISNGDGGILYLAGSHNNIIDITSSSTFNNVQAGNGGLMYLSGNTQQINLNTITLLSFLALNDGGVIYSDETKVTSLKLTIQSVTGNGLRSQNLGSFIKFNSLLNPLINITIVNSDLSCQINDLWSNFPTTYLQTRNDLISQTNLIGGLFHFEDLNTKITSSNNKFHNCYTTREGAIFYLRNVSLSDTGSSFKQTAGLVGAIYSEATTINLKNTEFKDLMSFNASVLLLNNGANATFDNVTMNLGKAMGFGGALAALGNQSSSLRFENCSQTNRYFESGQQGGFFYSENPNFDFLFKGCTFTDLYSGGGGAYIGGSGLKTFDLSNSQFTNITSGSDGVFILIDSSSFQFSIANVTMDCSPNFTLPTNYYSELESGNLVNSKLVGSLFFISNAFKVESSNNKFQNCKIANKGSIFKLVNTTFTDQNSVYSWNGAFYGGSIAFDNCTANLTNVTFMNNSARYGGGLSFERYSVINLKDIKAESCIATSNGGFLFMQDATSSNQGSLKIEGSTSFTYIQAYQNGGSIYVDSKLATVDIKDLTIQSGSAVNGGFLFLNQAQNVNLNNIIGIDLTSSNDGSFMKSLGESSINIISSQLYCQMSPSTPFSSIQQTVSTQNSAGAFFFENAIQVNSISNNISNCYIGRTGGVYSAVNSSLQINGTYRLVNNAALKGGALYCENCNMNIFDANFENLGAKEGGVLFIQNQGNVTFSNLNVKNTYASNVGGSFSFANSIPNTEANLILSGLTTINNTGSLNGGFLHSSNDYASVLPQGTFTVNQSQATQNGGVFYITGIKNIDIDGKQFQNFKSSAEGAFIYSTASNMTLSIKNMLFTSQTAASSPSSLTKTQAGAFYIKDNNGKVISLNNQFTNNQVAAKGGAFTLINSTLEDLNSQYQSNYAYQGGAIYCDSCNLNLRSVVFRNNYAYDGGTFYFKDNSTLNVSLSIFNSTAANQGGSIYYAGSSPSEQVVLKDAIIDQTQASSSGGLIYFDNENVDFSIDSCVITNSRSLQSSGGVIRIVSVKSVTIKNSTFNSFSAYGLGQFLYSTGSNVQVKIEDSSIQCTANPWDSSIINSRSNSSPPVSDSQSAFYIENAVLVQSSGNTYQNCYVASAGSVFTLYSVSNFSDDGSEFNYNSAIQGGVIFANQSAISVKNSKFNNNFGFRGGVFYLNNSKTFSIQNSNFTQNNAYIGGGIAYIIEPIGEDTIWVRNISNNYQISISQSNFNYSNSLDNGGAFYIESPHILQMTVSSSKFQNIGTTTNGGVFYINKFGGQLTLGQDSSNIGNTFTNINSFLKGSLLYSQATDLKLNIQGSTVTCRSSYTDYLKNTVQTQGGSIYIQNALNGITSSNNQFSQCISSTNGGVYHLINTFFSDSGSKYSSNSAKIGGTFSCSTCNMTFTNSQVSNSKAVDGGAFFIDNQAFFSFNGGSISNIYASNHGGVINVVLSNIHLTKESSISFVGTPSINNNSAAANGGFIYFDNSLANLTIDSSKLFNHQGAIGGVIYVIDINNLYIQSSQFQNFKASQSGFIHTSSANIKMLIQESQFICQSSLDPDKFKTQLSNQISQINTNFFIQNAQEIITRGNIFSKCGVSTRGGVFSLKDTQLTDSGSIFSLNSAITAGSINCENCKLNLTKTKFSENYGFQGGAITLESSSYLQGYQISFQLNTAYSSAGVMVASTQSYFEIDFSTFENNYSPQNSIFEVLGSSSTEFIKITGSQFKNNRALTNSITFMYSNAIIDSCSFINNTAQTKTKNIFVGFSTVNITNSQFDSLIRNNQINTLEDTQGTYLYIVFDVVMHVQNTKFLNGEAKQGGAVFLAGDSQVFFTGCQFTNNKVNKNGGAIYASNFISLIVGKNSIFTNNQALDGGDDFYLTNTRNFFLLTDALIRNSVAKNSIYGEKLIVKIQNTVIQDIFNNRSERGAALQCYDCSSILIDNTTFRNMRSIEGGAIYIEQQDKYKPQFVNSTNYFIKNCQFIDLVSEVGGAINIKNPQKMTIKNSTFLRNSAILQRGSLSLSGTGGALYYTCEPYLNCDLLLDNSTFKDNHAYLQGGAIFWDQLEPQMNRNVFNHNWADYYGNDIGCFSQYMSMITKEQYEQKMDSLDTSKFSLRMIEDEDTNYNTTQGEIDQQRSGGTIPTFYLAHIDKYGQIVASDFKSKVKVTLSNSKTNNRSSTYLPLLEGETQFETVAGMVAVVNFSFTGTPGQSYDLSFSTDGIDKTKKSNQQYLQTQQSESITFNLSVGLRECELGEQFTGTGKCEKCPEGSGFALQKMTEPGTCSKCPGEKAVCSGGSNIGPKPGYWRKNNITTNFIQCLYLDACLGMVAPDYNPQGSCREGYQGILCADCQVGYSRTGDYQCSLCPHPAANVVRLCFILVGVIIVIVYLVRSTLQGAVNVNNVTSIYLKIVLNHVQLVLLTAQFNFQWPTQVQEFFDIAKPVAATSTQLFSFDCFMDNRKDQSMLNESQYDFNGGMRIIFQKLLLYAFLPFVVGVFCITFWSIYRCIKKNQVRVKAKMMSTLVITLFLVHPNIVNFVFQSFKCLDIDGESRLQNDLEVICFSSQHKFFSFFVGIPSMAVWGLGIPFFAFLLLFNERKSLDTLNAKEKFGFLFRGYRLQFYFWEIIIMYRKITIIFISVFLIAIGVIAQALVVFIILILLVIVNIKERPFSTSSLNDLETLSLVTSLISVYSSFFFITDKPEEWIKANPQYSYGFLSLSEEIKLVLFGIIVASNGVFFAYWAYKMLQEVMNKFRKTLPRVYMFLCLCNNQDKFDRVMEEMRLREENDMIKDEFLRHLKMIRKLYYDGEVVLNNQKLDKFIFYTRRTKILQIMEDHQPTTEEDKLEKKKNKRYERIKADAQLQDAFLDERKQTKVYPIEVGFTSNRQIETQQQREELETDNVLLTTDRNNEFRKGWDLRIDDQALDQDLSKKRMIQRRNAKIKNQNIDQNQAKIVSSRKLQGTKESSEERQTNSDSDHMWKDEENSILESLVLEEGTKLEKNEINQGLNAIVEKIKKEKQEVQVQKRGQVKAAQATKNLKNKQTRLDKYKEYVKTRTKGQSKQQPQQENINVEISNELDEGYMDDSQRTKFFKSIARNSIVESSQERQFRTYSNLNDDEIIDDYMKQEINRGRRVETQVEEDQKINDIVDEFIAEAFD